jgi:hypothetical protein
VAELTVPENSASTVILSYPEHPDNWTSSIPPLPQQLDVPVPAGAASETVGKTVKTNRNERKSGIIFRPILRCILCLH